MKEWGNSLKQKNGAKAVGKTGYVSAQKSHASDLAKTRARTGSLFVFPDKS